MKIAKVALCVALALGSTAAMADIHKFGLNISGFSEHTQTGYNGVNPGVGLLYHNGDMVFELGRYKNSYYQSSKYALVDYMPYHYRDINAGVFAGIATGYTKEQNLVRPAVAGIAVNYMPGRYGLAFKAVPPTGPGTAGFVAVSFVMKF